MDEARFSKHLEEAFVLNGDKLKKLVELLKDGIGKNIRLELQCSDDVTRPYSSAKDALGYENPKNRSIEKIRITARSDDYTKSGTVEFRSKDYPGISIELTASELVVRRLGSDLLDVIGGTKARYDLIARFDPITGGPILFFLSLIVFMALLAFIATRRFGQNLANVQIILYLAILPFILLSVFVGKRLERVRKTLFPRGAFLTGQGKERHEHMEWVRWGVIGGILISVLGSIVAALLLLAF